MRYEFTGENGANSFCEIEFYGKKKHIVVVTEQLNNRGISITNGAEKLATKICDEYNISKEELIWLEDNTNLISGECAHITFDLQNGVFRNPKWQHFEKQYMNKLIESELQKEL